MTSFANAAPAATGRAGGAAVDVHQHAWPPALVEELRRRIHGPRLDGWDLHLPGEPTYRVEGGDHDLDARRGLDLADGIDLTALSLSAPLGVETLHPDEAAPLLHAWHTAVDEVDGVRQAVWAAVGLVAPDLELLRSHLAHPHVVGLQVPATALLTPVALSRLAPVLAVVEEAGLPVLVHPGPAPLDPSALGLPGWWAAMTHYPAQLSAAWHAWLVEGRALLPRLRIAFVGLAGLAPLHHERLAQRGPGLGAIDPGVFYETSSYGTRAIDALIRVVGVDPLVHGSDRPYALPTDPGLGEAFSRSLFVTNPARLLTPSAPAHPSPLQLAMNGAIA